VLTVALDFNFVFLGCVRTIIAAVLFGGGNLTPARHVCAFVLTSDVDKFCHDAPQFFLELISLFVPGDCALYEALIARH
jgi:hypothetical protein